MRDWIYKEINSNTSKKTSKNVSKNGLFFVFIKITFFLGQDSLKIFVSLHYSARFFKNLWLFESSFK